MKISEKKALETYPEIEGSETYFDRDYICTKPIDLNKQRRQGYIKGYEQAMQDFLEKACYYLKSTLQEDDETNDFIVQQFKNYMEDESKRTNDWRLCKAKEQRTFVKSR